MKEKAIQKSIAEALDVAGVTWFHPVNEQTMLSQADDVNAMLNSLCEQGLKPGIPDVMILEKPPEMRGRAAALEIKANDNTPTDNQREWLDRLAEINWQVAWHQGFDDCYQQLRDWGYV